MSLAELSLAATSLLGQHNTQLIIKVLIHYIASPRERAREEEKKTKFRVAAIWVTFIPRNPARTVSEEGKKRGRE